MAGDDSATFGDLVRRARRAAHLSQEELAERAGLSVRGISDLERGLSRAPRKDTLTLLANALDLSDDDRRLWDRARRQVATPGTPPQATSSNTTVPITHELPARLTSFVGREREVTDLTGLLGRTNARLVTIIGPGGIGKTSLALQVASEVAGGYRDGVQFVSLAPVHDPELVTTAIISALGMQVRRSASPHQALIDVLSNKHILLVLDNFEQVIDAATVVAGLLHACANVHVLVTSRMALRVSGEWEYPLAPLTLPSRADPTDVVGMAAAAAVAVFVDRARAVKPDFQLTVENAASVAEICHRLDGLPLAIELAAARIRHHPPAAILSRLEQRLVFLTGGVRDAPARQQTLRDTIRWSYDLLATDAQRLFRAVSVFRGGWSRDALDTIAGDGDNRLMDVEHGMEHLIEQSLVRALDQPDGEIRFTMLETIREFGLEQLDAEGERDTIQRQHADFFRRFFSPMPDEWRGPRVSHWLVQSEREIDNVRAALEWSSHHAVDTALQLCRAFGWYWMARGPHSEARGWYDRVLASSLPSTPALRAAALCRAAAFAISQRDHDTARRMVLEGLAIYRDLGDVDGIAEGVYNLGRIAMMTAKFDEAVCLFEESASLSNNLAFLIPSLSNLGNSRIGTGDYDGAAAALQEGLDLARQHDDTSEIGFFLAQQGLLALKRGDLVTARQQFAQGIPILRDLSELRLSKDVLEWCAWLATVEGKAEPTATPTLLGAASHLREVLDNPLQPRDEIEYEHYVPIAMAAIEPDDWARAWQVGRTMTLEAALNYALVLLSGTGADPTASPSDATTTLLSNREIEVLRLLVNGNSNQQIATALCISPNTAANHVSNILTKLGVDSRTAAATYALRHGLV